MKDKPTGDANSANALTAADDARVIAAVDEYLAALDAGAHPDRASFLAKHAEVAKPLAKCLEGLELVRHVAPQLELPQDHPASSGADLSGSVPLGDFQLLREIGRGGMGVVYEATQLSLGRRVALKVLPFAAALDAKQLQRFKNEAQAAAHLHHPHIVPVFAVGCERGVHYYAMQFIEGRSLAQLIGERRGAGCGAWSPHAETRVHVVSTQASGSKAPAFHTHVRWILAAAQALEHAHQVGVVHRDIKPANLLADEQDNLWITDFGLAQFQGNVGVTMTGDLLGTLRYMSPEQAAGRHEAVDHRTDIYSLGATLYEMLTLRPAFSENDRQIVLRQIADAEPPAPRLTNPKIPFDLETVVLKALAKVPAERYATAQEFADDLQRFLDDRPVLARRPTLRQRFSKAVRRHRTLFGVLAVSAVLMLVVAVVILGISARRIADREAESHANYLEAKKQHQRAEQNFKKTLAVVDRFLVRVGESKLGDFPQTAGIRRDLLLDALQYFEEFLAEKKDDPALHFEIASAHRRLGHVQSYLGQMGLAEAAYQRAFEICERLVAESPANLEYREELAHCCYWRCQGTATKADQERLLRRAIGLWQDLAAAPEGVRHQEWLSRVHHSLAYRLAVDDRMADAEHHYQEALRASDARLKRLPQDANAHESRADHLTSYGLMLRQAERFDEATKVLQEARELLGLAAQLEPKRDHHPQHRTTTARTLGHLGQVLWRQQRRQEAVTVARAAIANWEALIAEFPSAYSHGELALTLHGYATWLVILKQPQEAEQTLRQALRLVETVAKDQTPRPIFGAWSGDFALTQLAMIRSTLGEVLFDEGRTEEATEHFQSALHTHDLAAPLLAVRADVAGGFAWFLLTCPAHEFRDPPRALILAQAAVKLAPQRTFGWSALGLAHYRTGDYPAAVIALEKAVALRKSGDGSAGFILSMTLWQLGRHDAARKQLGRTSRWMDQDEPDHPGLRRLRAEAEKLISKN